MPMKLKKRIAARLSKNIHALRLLNLYRLTVRVLRTGAYYTRSFFYLPDKKLLYLSISKVGNTSIKASMYNLAEGDSYRDIHTKVNQLHVSGRIRNMDKFQDFYKFTFVRNPFQRLVSCYENKLHTDQAEVGESISFLIYDAYLLGFLSKDRGFSSFARRVCMIHDRIADRHFASQSIGALGPDGRLALDYVGKMERMNADYEPLRQRFGLAPLPHYNKTKKEKNWMDYYDEKTARRVCRRYRTDIEVFGYQGVYDELISYIKARDVGA